MQNCVMCGKRINNKAMLGIDYLKDTAGKSYCINCTTQCLTRWNDFERLEKLAEEPERYRNALLKILPDYVKEGYCVRPNTRCEDECVGCWMEYLVGERKG